MLPLALGTGPGAEERRTIAVVIIGGQLLALTVTLRPDAGGVFGLRRCNPGVAAGGEAAQRKISFRL